MKTPFHILSMKVGRSGSWAPGDDYYKVQQNRDCYFDYASKKLQRDGGNMKTEFGVIESTKGLCNLPHTSSSIAKDTSAPFSTLASIFNSILFYLPHIKKTKMTITDTTLMQIKLQWKKKIYLNNNNNNINNSNNNNNNNNNNSNNSNKVAG